MTFGEHVYDDLSHLNAQWQQERPAVHGLGAFYGQHEYRDVSYLNARLRPILPAEVGMYPMGTGTLSGNSLGVTTLDETVITGDKFTPAQIMEAQDQMNGALLMHGYQPIKVDGDLGPATCGAIKWYQENVNPAGGGSFEVSCSSVRAIAPSKTGGGTVAASHPSTATAPLPSQASIFGTGGGTNWLMLGGAFAAIAVGGALIYRANKRR